MEVFDSGQFLGSVSHMSILTKTIAVHKFLKTKKYGYQSYNDRVDFSNTYRNKWGILCDNGYQVVAESLVVVYSYKNTPNCSLTVTLDTFNFKRVSD